MIDALMEQILVQILIGGHTVAQKVHRQEIFVLPIQKASQTCDLARGSGEENQPSGLKKIPDLTVGISDIWTYLLPWNFVISEGLSMWSKTSLLFSYRVPKTTPP